jgi:hypothetical protein
VPHGHWKTTTFFAGLRLTGLSSDSQAVTRRCFHALAVHVDDAAVNACFEVFGIDEGPVGEVMTLQIAPGEFDVVEFGGVFRQPLDGEPGTGCERLAGQPAGVDRTVVEDENRRPRPPGRAAARSGGRSSRGAPRSRCCAWFARCARSTPASRRPASRSWPLSWPALAPGPACRRRVWPKHGRGRDG